MLVTAPSTQIAGCTQAVAGRRRVARTYLECMNGSPGAIQAETVVWMHPQVLHGKVGTRVRPHRPDLADA